MIPVHSPAEVARAPLYVVVDPTQTHLGERDRIHIVPVANRSVAHEVKRAEIESARMADRRVSVGITPTLPRAFPDRIEWTAEPLRTYTADSLRLPAPVSKGSRE